MGITPTVQLNVNAPDVAPDTIEAGPANCRIKLHFNHFNLGETEATMLELKDQLINAVQLIRESGANELEKVKSKAEPKGANTPATVPST